MFSNTASDADHINYAFQVANSQLPPLPATNVPAGFATWGQANSDTTLPAIVGSGAAQKSAIFLHRGWYGASVANSGSEGCIVGPRPLYYQFRSQFVHRFLNLRDPQSFPPTSPPNPNYWFLYKSSDFDEPAAKADYNQRVKGAGADWKSDPNSSPGLRALFLLIRPNEPDQ
jgi:hypothetical protein